MLSWQQLKLDSYEFCLIALYAVFRLHFFNSLSPFNRRTLPQCPIRNWLKYIQYNTSQYDTIQCNAIQYNKNNTIQCNSLQYNTMQYNVIRANTMQYSTIQFNSIQANTLKYNTYLLISFARSVRQVMDRVYFLHFMKTGKEGKSEDP